MTYKEKLINLLKTIPSVKEDLEELRFWCVLESKISWKIITYCWETDEYKDKYIMALWKYNIVSKKLLSRYKIIWNPLEERHLRMYCDKKWISLIINRFSQLSYLDNSDNLYKKICTLDNTESFDQQTEEVYEKIVEFLETNK